MRCWVLILLAAVCFAQTEVPDPPVRIAPPKERVTPSYFGMHIHEADTRTPWPAVAFGSWRLWDSRTTWFDLEPARGQWNFAHLDRLVELAAAHKVQILLTLGLTPKWASSRPDEVAVDNHVGVAAMPSDVSTWDEYVKAVATRYKGKISAYELWNEPNLNHYFSGTPQQMVRLAEIAYRDIKSIDPNAVVISPGTYQDNGKWLRHYLEAGGGKYCDAIGYHFYLGKNPPEHVVSMVQTVRALLAEKGEKKPLWNTESGWSAPFNPPQDASAFVSRALVLGWALGVQRYYWYAWDNYSWVGLQLSDRNTRLINDSGKAFSTTETWLVGSTIKSCSKDRQRLWTCSLSLIDSTDATLTWAEDKPGTFTIPPKATIIENLDGSRTSIRNRELLVTHSPVLIR